MASLLAILQAERAELLAKESAIITVIEAAGGKRTDEQHEALQAIDSRFGDPASGKGLLAEIAAEDRRRERERSEPAIAADEVALAAQAAQEAAEPTPPTPFRSLGEQLAAVAKAANRPHAAIDERLLQVNAAAHGANELVGSEGGFLVQTDFAEDLLGEVFETGILAAKARTREIGPRSNGVKFNVIADTSRATGSRYGGVRAYWTAEAGLKLPSKPRYEQDEITLQKLAGLYVSTDELLEDTVALESFVKPAFIEEFAFTVDDAMVRGTGAGMPLGILNSPALVTVSKEGGQAAGTMLYENVQQMFARLHAPSMTRAEWFINQGLYPQLFSMAMIIGTGGVPVFLPPSGVGASPFGNLLGRPVVPIEQASAPGELGDIFLADWQQYVLIRKGGIKRASSIHVYFDTDETAFRWVLRTNGRPWRKAPITPYKGSATLSPFVALQARS